MIEEFKIRFIKNFKIITNSYKIIEIDSNKNEWFFSWHLGYGYMALHDSGESFKYKESFELKDFKYKIPKRLRKKFTKKIVIFEL